MKLIRQRLFVRRLFIVGEENDEKLINGSVRSSFVFTFVANISGIFGWNFLTFII